MNKSIYWCDFLRIAACLMVVKLHSAAYYFSLYGKISAADWWVANLIDSFSRCAVPLFLMLSGFLLLGRDHAPLGQYFARRLQKIVVPLLFFSILGLAAKTVFMKDFVLNPFSILWEPAYYHLWFFYIIAILYLIFPVFGRPTIDPAKGMVVTSLLFVLVGGASHLGLKSIWFSSEPIFFYLLYAFAGFFLGKTQPSKKVIGTSLIVFVASGVSIAFLTWKASISSQTLNQMYFEYNSILVAASSLSAFILLRRLTETSMLNQPTIKLWIQKVSPYSLGIFGFHAFAIDALWRFLKDPVLIPLGPIVGIPLLIAFSVGISSISIKLLMLVDRKGRLIGL